MLIDSSKRVMRLCLGCGNMYLASNSEYVLSHYQTCHFCRDEGNTDGLIPGVTGFFTSDEHLRGYIKLYKPDLRQVRDKKLRKSIKELLEV